MSATSIAIAGKPLRCAAAAKVAHEGTLPNAAFWQITAIVTQRC